MSESEPRRQSSSPDSTAYPYPTSSAVSAVMRGNRKVGTKPEAALRSALHRRGLRFRRCSLITTPERKCRADIVFTARRVAVFVDGCFWHTCPQHGNVPGGRNTEYWRMKLTSNVERDRLNDAALIRAGWTVVRIWEHVPLDEAVVRVLSAIEAAGAQT